MNAKNKTTETPKKCFVIMPFGGWFDTYYREVYIPAIENEGFKAIRADDLYRPGNIVNDIWKYTKEADIILADLTDKNPNVFYELGLAHAITKPAILITASMDDVPFDLRSLRVIEYDKSFPSWGDILKEKISKSIRETILNPQESIPPTFLDVKVSNKISVSSESKEILELRAELDSLKREVRTNYINRSINPEKDTYDYFGFIHNALLHGSLTKREIIQSLLSKGVNLDYIKKQIEIAEKELEE